MRMITFHRIQSRSNLKRNIPLDIIMYAHEKGIIDKIVLSEEICVFVYHVYYSGAHLCSYFYFFVLFREIVVF